MKRRRIHKKHLSRVKALLVVLVFIAVTLATFMAASVLNESQSIQGALSTYGYLTILGLAIVAGLNAIVPIPAATFVPLFTEAGLYLPLIVLMLVIGTTIADLIGFALGRLGRDYVVTRYPKLIKRLERLQATHEHWTFPVIIAYAAIIPLPNELILIPLALMGYKARFLIVALLIGNTLNQAALAYGYENAFRAFF